jgi:hypothetical protein
MTQLNNPPARPIIFRYITIEGDNTAHAIYHRQRTTEVINTYGPSSNDYNRERFLALRQALNSLAVAVENNDYPNINDFQAALRQAVDSVLESNQATLRRSF